MKHAGVSLVVRVEASFHHVPIVGVSREYKQLWHVGVVVGQGVRSLRGCVDEGFIDVEK